RIRQSSLYAFDRLYTVEQSLVRLGVLHDQLRLAVDGQHQGVSRLPEAVQQVNRVALEVAERTDVVGKIEHVGPHQICIEFDDHTMVPARSTAAGTVPKIVPASSPNGRTVPVLDRSRSPLFSGCPY